jgi:tetratricopeptide (TPR) repeat protein
MKLRLAGLLAALVVASTPAFAAKPPLEQAKALTREATVEYDVGHFDQALELYTKAYEIYPKPALLFDIAQCHRLLGHYERALFFFHGYLREEPDAPNRPLAERLLQETQDKYDAERQAHAESTAAEPPAPAAPTPVPSMVPSSGEASPPSAESSASTAPLSPTFQVVGLVTAGVGVAMLGVGVYEGLNAASLSKKIEQLSAQHGAWSSQYQNDYNAGKTSATVADVLYVAGGVSVAAGVVLAWLGWPRTTQAAAVAVTPVAGGASLTVAGAW